MVGNTGRASDPRRIRRLKLPQPIEVQADEAGAPLRLRLDGVWQDAAPARRPWRVDQHWWRAEPVRRTYYRIEVPDGPPLTVYYDETAGTWSRQEY